MPDRKRSPLPASGCGPLDDFVPASFFGPPGTPWRETACAWWGAVQMGQRVQQQWWERTALRWQEIPRHWQSSASPADLGDLSLASMRWGLQEWDQSLMDQMTAALALYGHWRMDQAPTAGSLPWSQPAMSWEPIVDWCTQQPSRQMQTWGQVWVQAWADAGQRRHRSGEASASGPSQDL